MTSQRLSKLSRHVLLALVPMLLIGCDTVEFSDDEFPTEQVISASVDFSAMHYWPDYGEDIRSVGIQAFRVRSATTYSGDFDILLRPEAIQATFRGVDSGDSYVHSWDGADQEWSSLRGPVGSEKYFAETIVLRNERTSEEAEGLVVTRATIKEGGGVALEVQEVIQLP